MLLVYVDDILVAARTDACIEDVKQYLHHLFTIKDLGLVKYFLGIELARSSQGMLGTQSKYITDIIRDLGLEHGKGANTPLPPRIKLSAEGGTLLIDPSRYRRLVGRNLYLNFTRPDVSHAAQQLSQFLQHPFQSHWNAATHLVRYLKGSLTTDHGVERFNAAALEVPSVTQEVKASAFSQGLSNGDLFKSLAKKSASKFDALLARAAKYINMEHAQASKKENRGEKRKEVKEDAPSKKSRIDTLDKKLPFQRKREGDKAKETRTAILEQSLKEGAKQASGSKGKTNDIPRKGVIRMIAGGPSGGDSHQARKSQVRKAHDIFLREVLDVEAMEDTPSSNLGGPNDLGPRLPITMP
ncbi:UNVERIFIED_CONTAM: putative mitochondrial protein [Sesamum latifolium]|uniref:Mitochondrial protein n=1 Tax=Sesamum latifolium TaxID=2727402 RepID=A0AAW2UFI6_9LAMI